MQQTRYTAKQKQQMIDMYCDDEMGCTAIAKELDATPMTVYNVLKRYGVEMRKPGKKGGRVLNKPVVEEQDTEKEEAAAHPAVTNIASSYAGGVVYDLRKLPGNKRKNKSRR